MTLCVLASGFLVAAAAPAEVACNVSTDMYACNRRNVCEWSSATLSCEVSPCVAHQWEAECRAGNCVWGGGSCTRKHDCYYPGDPAACEADPLCVLEQGVCTMRKCGHNNEQDCLSGPHMCVWNNILEECAEWPSSPGVPDTAVPTTPPDTPTPTVECSNKYTENDCLSGPEICVWVEIISKCFDTSPSSPTPHGRTDTPPTRSPSPDTAVPTVPPTSSPTPVPTHGKTYTPETVVPIGTAAPTPLPTTVPQTPVPTSAPDSGEGEINFRIKVKDGSGNRTGAGSSGAVAVHLEKKGEPSWYWTTLWGLGAGEEQTLPVRGSPYSFAEVESAILIAFTSSTDNLLVEGIWLQHAPSGYWRQLYVHDPKELLCCGDDMVETWHSSCA
eukprot:TRINITY_DN86_c0_g1_i7.p1 TRINITY_DN86_c0_g1~~TRINITY_DN86_c0_g1_i7.p1  ORF type:complete len:386 (+),score=78.94 TRINITY_DN86_c0_g1_i7:42-1199(+)